MRSSLLLGALTAAVPSTAVKDWEAYRLKASSAYTKASDVSSPTLRISSDGNYIDTAKALAQREAPDATFRVIGDHYVGTNGVAHVYLKQTVHGLDVDNAVFNVNIAKDGSILSFGNSFYTGEAPSEKKAQSINAKQALSVAQETLDLPVSKISDSSVEDLDGEVIIKGVSGVEEDPQAKLMYFVKPDGELALTWRVTSISEEAAFTSYVDVENGDGKLVGVFNHDSHFTYEVYPFGVENPDDGEREIITDPEDTTASKLGWVDPDYNGGNLTYGNNVNSACVFQDGLVRFTYSETGDFQFPYEPDTNHPDDHRDAAVVQTFYITNMLHDLYYILGFTPAAGNFQEDNQGEGGEDGDAVEIRIQHWGDRNNGFMRQTADGRAPSLTMLLFDFTDPWRNGGFDNGFVVHEYTHGLSDRLTGGPATPSCLEAWEADGMAEGWSDIFSATLSLKPEDTRENATYGFATWATNATNPPTARRVLYSTNMEVNDWTYSTANGLQRPHEVGTVWCTMLYEILWNLIDKHGKNDSPRPDMVDGVPTDGKFLLLKLLVDAFSIQPCNPTFIQARDAILDADLALTGGANACEIWSGFAKRGLGANAETAEDDNRVDDFDLPDSVC